LPAEDFISEAVIKVLMVMNANDNSKKPKKLSLGYVRTVAQNALKNIVADAMYRNTVSVDAITAEDEDGKELPTDQKLAWLADQNSKDSQGIARERKWDDYINWNIPGGEFTMNEPQGRAKTRQILAEAMERLPKVRISAKLRIPGVLQGESASSASPPMDVALMIKLNTGALEYDDITEGAASANDPAYTKGHSCIDIGAGCDPPVSGRVVQYWINKGYAQIRDYFFQKFSGLSSN
jgi:hypothetical protein